MSYYEEPFTGGSQEIEEYLTKVNENFSYIKSALSSMSVSQSASLYSNYSLGTSAPQNPLSGDIYFNTTSKKLYMYSNGEWCEIDWISKVATAPEYRGGYLKVENDTLYITPDNSNWYACYPVIGNNVIDIGSPQSFNNKLWIPPGVEVVLHNTWYLPIVYSKLVTPVFKISLHRKYGYKGGNIELMPNNTTVSGSFGAQGRRSYDDSTSYLYSDGISSDKLYLGRAWYYQGDENDSGTLELSATLTYYEDGTATSQYRSASAAEFYIGFSSNRNLGSTFHFLGMITKTWSETPVPQNITVRRLL